MKFKSILAISIFLISFHLTELLSCASDGTQITAGFTSYMKTIEPQIPVPTYEKYSIPKYTGFKSYMPYNLFSKKSNQYALQTNCTTDSDGFRRIDDYYVIALGSYFGELKIGQRVDLVLANGELIQCVLGDVKDDKHTDAQNLFTWANNCMSEFIIDPARLDGTVKYRGDASYLPSQSWNSQVGEVYIYDDNVLS